MIDDDWITALKVAGYIALGVVALAALVPIAMIVYAISLLLP